VAEQIAQEVHPAALPGAAWNIRLIAAVSPRWAGLIRSQAEFSA
jgi:hypothetical protein